MVIWLVGMSGAGKRTIGREMYRRLKATHSSVVFLDKDSIRNLLGIELGTAKADPQQDAMRISQLCRTLCQQGIDVVCAFPGCSPQAQQWNRANIPQYFELFIRVPFHILVERDSKGLYEQVLQGGIKNVMGIDIEIPLPATADLVFENDKPLSSFAGVADSILQAIPCGPHHPTEMATQYLFELPRIGPRTLFPKLASQGI